MFSGHKKEKYLCNLRHGRQTDGLSKLYAECSLLNGIFTQNYSRLSQIAAEISPFLHCIEDWRTDKMNCRVFLLLKRHNCICIWFWLF